MQYILFDLDGTLTESGPGIVKAVQYALRSVGIEETDEDKLRLFVGPPLEESFRVHYGFSGEEAVKLIRTFKEYYDDGGVYENRPYDGVEEMLQTLSDAGLYLCIASSKPQDLVDKVTAHFQLADYFRQRIGGTVDRKLLEKEDVIREVFRRIALDTGEDEETIRSKALMVGDRKYDVKGAKIAGIPCLGILYGYGSRVELEDEGADYIAKTVEETKEKILSLAGATA